MYPYKIKRTEGTVTCLPQISFPLSEKSPGIIQRHCNISFNIVTSNYHVTILYLRNWGSERSGKSKITQLINEQRNMSPLTTKYYLSLPRARLCSGHMSCLVSPAFIPLGTVSPLLPVVWFSFEILVTHPSGGSSPKWGILTKQNQLEALPGTNMWIPREFRFLLVLLNGMS